MSKLKILIIGDNPDYIGGVCNYTRPLHKKLSELGNEVHYLYSSGGYIKNYNFFFFSYIKSFNKSNNLHFHELINSPNGIVNYPDLDLDTSSRSIEKAFSSLLMKINPDIIHIHEMIGFSSSVIKIAKCYNKKVLITIHEYWWLCPHRVMIDFHGQICAGPLDHAKCSTCIIDKYSKQKKINKLKLAFINKNRGITSLLLRIKNNNKFKKNDNQYLKNKFDDKQFDNELFKNRQQEVDSKVICRLRKNIEFLNMADKIIAVSNEVKGIMTKFGVQNEKIIVQHIGSEIASHDYSHILIKERESISFGFIGGVNYYKGIHILVEAFLSLNNCEKNKSQVLIFGKTDLKYKETIDLKHKNIEGYERIEFKGAYKRDDLIKIYSQIDIMVLPSLCNDTAPQTIFESYAAKIPIIAPKIGGFPDFINDGENGFLFEVGNSVDLKNKLERIINNKGLISSFRKKIPKLKSINENSLELLKMYRELINA